MKKNLYGIITLIFLVACSNGDSNNSATGVKSDDGASYMSIDDLPNCTPKREGLIVFVEESNANYVCDGKVWMSENEVEIGHNSSEIKNSSSSNIALSSSSKRQTSSGVVSSSSSSKRQTSSGVVSSSSSSKRQTSSGVVSSSSSSKRQSSSGVVSSSSSMGPKSSSSVSLVDLSILTDTRDGKTYNIVTIGSQIWMAENLNYKMDGSFCYNDSANYCTKYGRLYTFKAALAACPNGWHLPDTTEANTLFTAIGGKSNAGRLKSSSGWKGNGNGLDSYGFSALPAGFYDTYINDGYAGEGEETYFWSSDFDNMPYDINLYYGKGVVNNYAVASIDSRLSVRCLKTEPVEKMLTDPRDGKKYRIVTIGSQTWFAENLNYEMKGSLCYKDSAIYCSKYGRLYTWENAMNACPTGWHLPSRSEWSKLFYIIGGSATSSELYPSRVDFSRRWNDSENAFDDYGFSLLPSGAMYCVDGGLFEDEGIGASFWSSSLMDFKNQASYSDNHAYYIWWNKNLNQMGMDIDEYEYAFDCGMLNGFSVRCVKD